MKNLRTLFLFILFFSSLIFAGSKWTGATRFSTHLTSAPVSDGFNIFALSQDGLLYSIKTTDGISRILTSLHSQSHIPIQKGRSAFFAGTDNGKIYAYSIRTTKEMWNYPQIKKTYGQQNPQDEQETLELSDIYYYDGVLYAAFKTRLMAFSENTGTLIFERNLEEGACVSADAYGIYVSDGDKINTYSKDGRLRWSVTTGPLYKSCPTPLGDNLYIPTTRSNLLALNSATGQTEWAYPINGWALSNPILIGSSILFGTSQGEVLSINAQTGHLNYKTALNGPIWASPAILTKGSQSVAIFGTHNNSVYALNPNTGDILFNYQVSDWVDHLTIADDEKTILIATRDNALWALTSYPICTIDYPRTNQIIPQEITVEGRAFSFSGINSVQLFINSKAYPPKTLQGKNTFKMDVSLTQEPLNLVDVQCIATDKSGLIETDHLDYKTQPILSLGARKLNMSVQVYPSNPNTGEQFTIYIRNSQGFDTQDVLLEYMNKNQTVSSPYKTTAPADGRYKIVARKSGYYPAEIEFSTSQDMGLIPLIGGLILLLIIIGVAAFFLTNKKKKK